ncbi:MAG: carboxypeptidase-like regulatory domain-containing protein, partial [Alistipes onderdonkii]
MAALLACLCLLPDMAAHAQSPPRKVVVNGRVADESGDPVAGATIVERGTSNGVATLSEGEFSIAVLPGAVLDVSCLGYIDQSIGTGTRTEFEIVLQEDVKAIAEVIVTALGLERNYADLTYSADKIRGAQLTAVKDPNLILSLSGKSAGVQVNKNSSGAGASAKVSIRGVRSVASDNQPLYVVDGMPILNSTPEQAYSAIGGVADAGNRDGGDGISNLNAEDI